MIDSWLVSSTVIKPSSFQALTALRRVAWHFTTCVSCTCRDRWRWLASTSWSCYGQGVSTYQYTPQNYIIIHTCHRVIYNHIHNNTSQYNMYCNIVICIMPSCHVHHSLSDCQCNLSVTPAPSTTKRLQQVAYPQQDETSAVQADPWSPWTLGCSLSQTLPWRQGLQELPWRQDARPLPHPNSSKSTSERMILQISGGHTVQMEIYEQLWTYIKESPAPPWKLHCWRQVSTFAICQTVKASTKIHFFLPYLPFSLVWGENKGVVSFFRGTGLQEQYLYMLYWTPDEVPTANQLVNQMFPNYIILYIYMWVADKIAVKSNAMQKLGSSPIGCDDFRTPRCITNGVSV